VSDFALGERNLRLYLVLIPDSPADANIKSLAGESGCVVVRCPWRFSPRYPPYKGAGL